MELWQALIFGLIVVSVCIFADRRRKKSLQDYLNRKRIKTLTEAQEKYDQR